MVQSLTLGHLNSVHGARGERGVGEGQRGTQQVSNAIEVVLVLLDGFNAHPVSGQQSLVARGIARRGHELEVSMATTKKKPSPVETETRVSPSLYLFESEVFIYFIYHQSTLWQQCLELNKRLIKKNISMPILQAGTVLFLSVNLI